MKTFETRLCSEWASCPDEYTTDPEIYREYVDRIYTSIAMALLTWNGYQSTLTIRFTLNSKTDHIKPEINHG